MTDVERRESGHSARVVEPVAGQPVPDLAERFLGAGPSQEGHAIVVAEDHIRTGEPPGTQGLAGRVLGKDSRV